MTDLPDLRVCPLCDTRVSAGKCPHDGHATVRPEELVARRIDDPLIGATLEGKYQVEQRVGVGAMGSVYRAVNLRTGSPLAIKIMHPAMAESGAAVRRFLLEAQNASKLDNPHIVRVLDRGETPHGLPFMVMEFVDGQTLEALLEAGPLPAARVVAIAEQIVKGLGGAHRRGLIHRDIKPENVMLVDVFGDELHVKLLDFGIARAASEQPATGTMVLGTPRYMAPEQWSAQAVLDARSDLYSLGCVMYHMLAGRPPFVIETPDERRMVQLYQSAHLTQLPPPLPIPGTSPLAMLVDDLLRKDPAQRPPSAEEVLHRLRGMREHPTDAPPPKSAARSARDTQPESDHPGVMMPTMLLPVDKNKPTIEQQAPRRAPAPVPEPADSIDEPANTVLLGDEDAPTQAMLSPGRVLAAMGLPQPAPEPEPAQDLDDGDDGPTIALIVPAPPIAPAPRSAAPARATPPAPRPTGRKLQNVETLPPPLPSGFNLPAAPAGSAATVTPAPVPVQSAPVAPWVKWFVGTLVAVALGVLLGVLLGGR
jgi:serine/threonine protein kinase